MTAPQRTAPVSVILGALGSIRSAILPAIAIAFSGVGGEGRYWLAIGVGAAAALIGTAFSWLGWRRLTYTIGESDVRVESGVISRTARAVPYERIQDVSLEATPLARMLGLVAVKFETGAGGGDDLALQYLTAAEGERLRQLVRERREDEVASADLADPQAPPRAEDAEVLYALTPRRLLTFGMFEFSLAVFAVLGGALQYVDNVTGIELWDVDLWRSWLSESGETVASLGFIGQVIGTVAGVIGLIAIGFATGIARTMLRDWGFTLTRSPRGFRRQRGLLTRTDVVMPVHRVQGLVIGTGLLRYRFGWHGLSFVSLAQDAEDESHVVAPFAQMEELAPIVAAAGFALPDEGTHWQRSSKRHRNDRAVLGSALFVLATIAAAIFAPMGVFLIPLGLAVVAVGAQLYAWQFRRFALSDTQIFATTGLLSPTSRIATRLKLHSVEIAQGPLARLRGYATVHLGLAGGSFAVPGVPLADARALRASILRTIAATDYARIDAPLEEPALTP
ncbi:PH domain-containing protein [Porphyrobacter sp. YT40]|uniref:PH domain-containing protein n=1 Tax=Porphyrobacter sp. YT40 TaxID=2547601 RepID=UPI0011413EDA|nr:PH domain-containing protein [Porphyrobacter sp. YT40]QDH33624.1 PH domain-containing protein [Porphyrobacter sp. YT40]